MTISQLYTLLWFSETTSNSEWDGETGLISFISIIMYYTKSQTLISNSQWSQWNGTKMHLGFLLSLIPFFLPLISSSRRIQFLFFSLLFNEFLILTYPRNNCNNNIKILYRYLVPVQICFSDWARVRTIRRRTVSWDTIYLWS